MLMYFFAILCALADSGAEWLQKIDQKSALDSAHMVLQLEVIDKRGNSVSREMEIWQQGDHSRLVRLQQPARLQGVGLLVSQNNNLHLFLPQYPPARRVLNSKRSDSFLGTDFAIDDLARLSYASQYSAEYIGADNRGHHLRLTPLDSSVKETIQLWCDENGNVLTLEHYTDTEIISRRLQFTEYKSVNGVDLAHFVSVEDISKNQRTNATLIRAEVNTTIRSEIFTLSNLENP